MKAYVSVDLEGMPFIVSGEHLFVKGSLYSEARRIATRITLVVAETLHEEGFEEIIIADSHGPMINLEVEDLPEYIVMIRGSLRPLSMVVGVERADIALFLGYHAKAGTARATFDHTYSSASIDYIEINGERASEYLLNTYVAGHYGVPVVLVAGDKVLLEEDVSRHTPWAERVVLKESLSRFSAISSSMKRVERELKIAVKRAVEKYKRGETKPLKTSYPVEVKIRFLGTEMADIFSLLPIVERIDGKTIRYTARDIVDAYKIFQFIASTAPRLYPYTYAQYL